MGRVLKSRGYLILNVTNRFAYIGILEELYRWAKSGRVGWAVLSFIKQQLLRREELHRFPDRRTHSPFQFDRVLKEHGFEKITHNYFHFSPLPTPLDSVLGPACSRIGKLMERFTVSRLATLLGGGYLARVS
jgi:hypothetical protein